MADAIVLAGAVAKGAFAAGAMAALFDQASPPVDVRCIVAASSGAINGVYLAREIRNGTAAGAGERLANIWLDDATFMGAFDVSVRGIVHGRGLSDDANLLRILRSHVPPASPGASGDVLFRVVVTDEHGALGEAFGRPATTFERVLDFEGHDFDDQPAVENVLQAVLASAAFPGAYVPVSITLGDQRTFCIDGGATNNAPIRYAVEGAPEVARVFVVAPAPRIRRVRPSPGGLSYVSHLADILIEERLYRDLRDAAHVNEALTAIDRLVPDAAVRAQLLAALGWTGRRPIEVVEIRPDNELPGNAFSGLFSRETRQAYVDAGRAAGRRALGSVPST